MLAKILLISLLTPSLLWAQTPPVPEQLFFQTVSNKRDFCPTDREDRPWSGGIIIAGAVCLAASVLPVCVIPGFAIGFGYLIMDLTYVDNRVRAEKAAKATCAAGAPYDKGAGYQAAWKKTCEELAYHANFAADVMNDPKKGTQSIKPAPYGLDDSITDWMIDNKRVKYVAPFMNAQDSLRATDAYASCLSDEKNVERFAAKTDITLREGVELMMANLQDYGYKAYSAGPNSLDDYSVEEIKAAAVEYKKARQQGLITEFQPGKKSYKKSFAARQTILWAYFFGKNPDFKTIPESHRREDQYTWSIKDLDVVADYFAP